MAIPGRVVILGANGSVGRALAPILSARGISHRVVGRSLLGLQVRFHGDPLCEHYQWDTEDKRSFRAACENAETAVYLVGIALWKFKDHLPLIRKTLKGAREAGIRRFLLMSSNWSYSEPFPKQVGEDHPRRPRTVKGRIRREQEDAVLDAHVPGEFATGVLRVADLYGPLVEASHLWTAFQAAKRGAKAQALPPVDRPHEFVFVSDAAEVLAQLLEADAAWEGAAGQSWNLGGPAVTSIQAMAEQIFQTAESSARLTIPSRWRLGYVRAVNPYIRELGEMQYLLERPLLLDDRKLEALLGTLPKTSYGEAIRKTLEGIEAPHKA